MADTNSSIIRRGGGRLLAVQLLGLISAFLLLDVARRNLLFDFNDAAMGDYTSRLIGDAAAGGRVHCTDLEIEPCLAAWRGAGQPPAIFWVGNSQLHGVNRMKEGDRTAIQSAHDALAPDGDWLVGYSLPNITATEIVAAVDSVGLDYRPRLVVVPVVLNGLRGGSVRDSALPLLQRPGVAARIRGSRSGRPLLPLLAGKVDAAAAPRSIADRTEDALEAGLSDGSALWRARSDLRALYVYGFDMGRHRVFGVNAQTQRSLINPNYREQMALLADLATDLRARGIKVLFYVPPYRRDIPGPYIPAEYAQFKAELRQLCATTGARCADFDTLVPGPEWGLVKDHLFGGVDYDFMHFTANGHDALARAVVAEARDLR